MISTRILAFKAKGSSLSLKFLRCAGLYYVLNASRAYVVHMGFGVNEADRLSWSTFTSADLDPIYVIDTLVKDFICQVVEELPVWSRSQR